MAIKRARELVPAGQFHVGVLEDAPFAGVSFDAIVMIDFIEHVRDPELEVRAAAERLAGGGQLVISTPRVDSGARRITGHAWPQYREEHLTYFSAAGMHALMQRAGLVVTQLTSTKKMLTPAYLYGQAVMYPVPVITQLLKATWRFLPIPKHHPVGLRLGEMTVVARRRDTAAS
jgi:2-polyprenyl-3-methyl-5-hydroxy-6-metoxy-1,4-benzoquinol methylase